MNDHQQFSADFLGEEQQPLTPARMLSEFAYCSRLGYLMWAQAEFEHNADTLDGVLTHRRVDQPAGALAEQAPSPDNELTETLHARSVLLSAPNLKLIAKLDLLELDGDRATPVEYKRGEAPETPERAWESERVQLCAQGLILRENGYRCDGGVLYYAASKQRVDIPFDEPLIARTLELLRQFRDVTRQPLPPPPLVDSPRCPRCSLVGICLPDETNMLANAAMPDDAPDRVRRLIPVSDESLPLYVQDQGAYVGKSGESLLVKIKGEADREAKFIDTAQVCLFGGVQISTQAVQALLEREIPLIYFSQGGWFYGMTQGLGHKNIDLRRAQFAAAADPHSCLAVARALVADKAANCRTLLRRNHANIAETELDDLRAAVESAEAADCLDSLFGIEGNAARIYFSRFAGMLKQPHDKTLTFDFQGRNRRPPKDPVNALLSFLYALLTKDCAIAAVSTGLDVMQGFYHQPRYGRPALALDLMEPFRPLIVDSTVLIVINNEILDDGDFIRAGGGIALRPTGRRKLILAYERRMGELVTHPLFGYRLSYRRLLYVQARLLGRYLLGEHPTPPAFRTR